MKCDCGDYQNAIHQLSLSWYIKQKAWVAENIKYVKPPTKEQGEAAARLLGKRDDESTEAFIERYKRSIKY